MEWNYITYLLINSIGGNRMTVKMVVIAIVITIFVFGAIVSYAGCRAASMAEDKELEAEIQSIAISSEDHVKKMLL